MAYIKHHFSKLRSGAPMPANLRATACIADGIRHTIQHGNVVSQCTLLSRHAGARAGSDCLDFRIHVPLASRPGSTSHSLYLGRLGNSWRSRGKLGRRQRRCMSSTRVYICTISLTRFSFIAQGKTPPTPDHHTHSKTSRTSIPLSFQSRRVLPMCVLCH